ncbi:head maturation protease, ClpP-related [Planctomicrobium sp. SH527]|uniref:head maturation protease, ClpP-related n=1 Tax=Planctomicrobium sp. SH527 TaxID=3448123 RepID=UPI003F5B2E77
MSFQIRADAGSGTVPTLYIYDTIERAESGNAGFTLGDLQRFLDANRTAREILVEISSTGGDAYAGIAIYEKLISAPQKVRTRATGIVASAASIIFLAGDVREMSENAELMIHNASVEAVGGVREMEGAAQMLHQLNRKMAQIISQRTGQPEQIVKAWMNEEKWLGAHDARSLGFATNVSGPVQITASLDVSRFKNTPTRVKQLAQARLITAMNSHSEGRSAKQSPEALIKKHGQPKSLADVMAITNGRPPASVSAKATAKPKVAPQSYQEFYKDLNTKKPAQATKGKTPKSLAEVIALTNKSAV